MPWETDENAAGQPSCNLARWRTGGIFGSPRDGHSVFTQILPYVEQGNLLLIARIDLSILDPNNLPPPLGTSNAGLQIIKI